MKKSSRLFIKFYSAISGEKMKKYLQTSQEKWKKEKVTKECVYCDQQIGAAHHIFLLVS